ncbi:IS5 family transposase [Methylocapsa palsarum]|uniref:Transposase DDE domain-containing protein n=1 Tax=Methylocapsa palsarum TaxID=1612308 RepID=A0A1I4DEU8_9HYPH|nr:IS5 family transposase [Methylocapsa palsarum]SFK90401.1 Transposase DDE domain-containing protein [Methylocapsa palsarum]
MRGEPGFFDVDERLKRLSGLGDHLEGFAAAVDFEMFRADLVAALGYSDGAQGGRPPFDPVMMFKILVIQAMDNLSDERAEFLINDRMSFMRFLGLTLADRVPDARTIWLFREKLAKAGAIEGLFAFRRGAAGLGLSCHVRADRRRHAGRGAQATQQRGRKEGDQGGAHSRGLGGEAREITAERSRRALDRRPDGTKPPVDIAIPTFGYQNHVAIDQGFGFIRKWMATDAAAYEGARLREGLLDKTNTAASVWADTAYRSAANEAFLAKNGFRFCIHRKKPKGRPMPDAVRRANALKSTVRSRVEHVFAEQKDRMGLFSRTIGVNRAKVKIGMTNLVYNFKRLVFWRRIAAA